MSNFSNYPSWVKPGRKVIHKDGFVMFIQCNTVYSGASNRQTVSVIETVYYPTEADLLDSDSRYWKVIDTKCREIELDTFLKEWSPVHEKSDSGKSLRG